MINLSFTRPTFIRHSFTPSSQPSNNSSRRHNMPLGFTLIELLITTTIITLLTGMALPS